MKKNILLLSVIVFLFSCKNGKDLLKLEFPLSMQHEISNHINADTMIVYFHTGDCSFCYGQLLSVSREFPGLPLISICELNDSVLVDYYLDQIDFKGLSLLDSDSLFLNGNSDILKRQNTFLICADFSIIVSGNNLDDETKSEIHNKINCRSR